MFKKATLVVLVLTLILGLVPILAQEAEVVSCGTEANATLDVPEGIVLVDQGDAAKGLPVIPPGGDKPYQLNDGARWYVLDVNVVGMTQICKPGDPQAVGWTISEFVIRDAEVVTPEAVVEPVVEATVEAVIPEVVVEPAAPVSSDVTLDGDEQLCDQPKCSFDLGVNAYEDPEALVQQVGFAWGAPFLEWDGNITEGDVAFVQLQSGFYLDLTEPMGGGHRIYNIPKGWDETRIAEFAQQVKAEVLAGQPEVEITVWDSQLESISGSAMGDEGVGPGDNYPQLDGQQFSCFPEMGPCVRHVTVLPERQVGIVFGAQISSGTLAGPKSDDPQESLRDPEFRCDLVVLAPGTFDLVINDGRVEIYNVPEFDSAGWFQNLVAERAEEQSINYVCPQHEIVPIWHDDGTAPEQYTLRWIDTDATAGGPQEVPAS